MMRLNKALSLCRTAQKPLTRTDKEHGDEAFLSSVQHPRTMTDVGDEKHCDKKVSRFAAAIKTSSQKLIHKMRNIAVNDRTRAECSRAKVMPVRVCIRCGSVSRTRWVIPADSHRLSSFEQ